MLQVLGEGAVVGAAQGWGSPAPALLVGGCSPSVPRHSRAIPTCKRCLLNLKGGPGVTACAMSGCGVSPTAELSPSAQPQSVLGEWDRDVVHPC